jgi:hypothetical protein
MKRNVPNEVSLLPSNYSLYDRVHLLSFFIVHLFGDYFSSAIYYVHAEVDRWVSIIVVRGGCFIICLISSSV